MIKTFELTMRLKNNLIKKRRLELGLSPKEAADRSGISYALWLQYEAMTKSPLSKSSDRKWRESALRIAEFFCIPPEELFPDAVLSVQQSEVVTEINEEHLACLAGYSATRELPYTPCEMLEKAEEKRGLEVALSKLSSTQRRLLVSRFGLVNGREQTLQEIGDRLGLSKERIRIWQENAICKLRAELWRDDAFMDRR